MAKFFKNIKCGVIEEVEDKDVIRMMEESDVYEEVEDPTKAKAEAPKAEPKAKK